MSRRLYFLTFLYMLAFPILQAPAQNKLNRPKIGVVLSGGGAKGLAHIGFLKVLEEAGIVPDIITGTSMGSIIGGLYAIGYSADELDSIATNLDWTKILANSVPLHEINIEEKPYYGRYLTELYFEDGKLSLPSGVLESENLHLVLSRLTQPAQGIEYFQDLPIPFACMGSDIATGDPIVMNCGSLPEALRASMAIPSIFTPVEYGGRFLVDGGLFRNFPVQEAIDMGADIIIGVNVASDLKSFKDLNGMVEVLTQSTFVLSTFDTRQQKEKLDVLIQPNLESYSMSSFTSAPQIIQLGYNESHKFLDSLKVMADSVYRNEPPLHPKKLTMTTRYHISEIEVNGNKRVTSELIRNKLDLDEHSTYSLKDIEERILLIYGNRNFSKVTYELVKQKDSDSFKMIVKVKENPQSSFRLGIYYQSETPTGIVLNYTTRDFPIPFSRFVTEFELSKLPRLDVNFLKIYW